MAPRARNTTLVQLREDTGLSQSEMARRLGVNNGTICALETCRESPLSRDPLADDPWTSTARKLANFHGLEPDELWPDHALQLRSRALMLETHDAPEHPTPLQTIENTEQLEALATVFDTLDPRQQNILKARIVDETPYHLIANNLGISKERVRQVEQQALTALRKTLCPEYQRNLERKIERITRKHHFF